MGITQLPLFDMLANKMRWHQARQNVLAENVANANTPGFLAHDLKTFDAADEKSKADYLPLTTTVTQPAHFMAFSTSSTPGYAEVGDNRYEITPSGNGVTLEDQMTKVAENQIDYQTVTALYTRSVGILKIALGKSA